jgi:putative endonuclease
MRSMGTHRTYEQRATYRKTANQKVPNNARMLPAVYILASAPYGTLYIGVTSNLIKRIWEHKHGVVEGFTKKYGVHTLVYYETCEEMYSAIQREKQLKKFSREKKIALIQRENRFWCDLYPSLLG